MFCSVICRVLFACSLIINIRATCTLDVLVRFIPGFLVRICHKEAALMQAYLEHIMSVYQEP